MPWSQVGYAIEVLVQIIAADVFMIILGLFGAVNSHKFKWGYYAMACFCEVAINIGLVFNARRSAFARGGGVYKVYVGMAVYLSILWWGYPIVWGLAEGSNTISSDAEHVQVASYAGLDIAAKVFFGWMIMAMYPVISKQQEREAQEGKGFPSVLEATIDAPLSITQGPNAKSNAQATHGLPPVEPAARNGAPVVAPTNTSTVV
ncbi:MAG: hypothetical protein M1835_001530 [Candelina submexicana]|nr:MAG: hypothetical protein M1835_001530 [Candelina submexicana]